MNHCGTDLNILCFSAIPQSLSLYTLNRVGRGVGVRLWFPLLHQDDLPDKVVTSHEISKFAKENNFIYWSFISVKENRNIPEAMK